MNQTPEYYNKKQQEERAETFNNVTLIDYGQIF
jgi:hypothetical protein